MICDRRFIAYHYARYLHQLDVRRMYTSAVPRRVAHHASQRVRARISLLAPL